MKNKFKLILFILICIIIAGTTTYAATIISSEVVSYDNSNGMTSTNVKDAIDELYSRTN